MELDGDSPPIWSQPTTTLLRQRRRQPPSPPIINPVVLILLLPILALLILFFLVPPFLTHTTQILRPNSVKKGWDSFNILLVVFAILCGVFARKNDDNSAVDGGASVERNTTVSTSDSSSFNDDTRQHVSNDRWFEPSGEKTYNFAPVGLPETGLNRLRRSSSSYPDLRQVPQWETGENQSRFFDDFGVNLYRSTASEYHSHRQRRSERQREEPDIKVIPVDTFEIRSSPPQPPSPEKPPITSSKPPQANLKRRRSFHSVTRKDKVELQSNEAEVELNEKQEPPPPSSPPPPSMPTELTPPVEQPQDLQRRKSGTKELATAIASLYNQSKRNRRTKKRDMYESVSDSPPSAEQFLPPATPPPPPPPPPSKVFQNLFKKNRKSKRVHSDPSNVPSPPPPPPPPPPNSIFNLFKTGSKRFQQTASTPPPPPPPPPPSILNNLFKHGTKSRRFKSPISTPTPPPPPPPPPQARVSSRQRKSSTPSQPPMQPPCRRSSSSSKPPLPTKPVSSYYDDNLNSGSQSPLIPMPPPPPMPPFKMREMKFISSGDFVSIRSAHSSRCSSPDLEDVDVDVDDVSVRSSVEAMDGEDLTGPSVSCPSPDVNMKADTFIARLRDEWRLEKMNSLREKSTSG